MSITRSKLNGEYPTALIQKLDKEHHKILKDLRAQPCNKQCAECQACPSTWASVSLGVFVCMRCAQVHRNLGTHISKVKSCMGTYLWCPDEIERMRQVGNARAWALYTGGASTPAQKPGVDAPFEEVDEFARNKYERKRWLHPGGMAAVLEAEQAQPRSVNNSKPTTAAAAAVAPRSKIGGRNTSAREAARNRVTRLRGRSNAAAVPAPSLQRVSSGTYGSTVDDEWGSFREWPSSGSTPAAPLSPPPPPPPTATVAAAPNTQKELTLEDFFLGGSSGSGSSGSGGGGNTLVAAPAVATATQDLLGLFSMGVGAAAAARQQQTMVAAAPPPPVITAFRPSAYA